MLRIRGGRKTNYAYAAARVQARRSKLIPESEYEKLLKMDLSEITRYIEDSAYKAEVDELSGRFRGLDLLEAALTVNQERANAAVRRMVDGEGGALVVLWLQRFLVENLKAVLRGKQSGAGREELLKELLLEDLDSFSVFQPLLADDVRSPEEVTAVLERQGTVGADWARVLGRVPPDAGLSAYEDALDKAYFAQLVENLEQSGQRGSDLMLDFVRSEIDATNLQNAARWVVSGQGGDFSPYVVPGGRLVRVADAMALSRRSDLAELTEGVAELGLPASLHDALREGARVGRLAPFQAALRHWHFEQLDRLGHKAPLSIVPILLYLARKHREVLRLRALARGRAAGLSEERLRELVA